MGNVDEFVRTLQWAFDQWNIRNFTPLEFVNIEDDILPPMHRWLQILPTARLLQTLRDQDSGAIHITSAYRSPEYNALPEVGGAVSSQHPLFTATDIVCENWGPNKTAFVLENHVWRNQIAVGRYNTFTHVDTRHFLGNPQFESGPARWDNRT